MLPALSEQNSPFDTAQARQVNEVLLRLDAGQSAWLSGYLAGCLALGGSSSQQATESQVATGAGPALDILYASETGNGRGLAEALAEQAASLGLQPRLQSLDGFRPADLRKLAHAAFVISTHGEGDPPEEAIALFDYLQSPLAADLSGLRFSVLALGDRSYNQFCAAGRKLQALLESRRARPFAARVECDIDYAADGAAWSRQVLDYARKELKPPAVVTSGARLSVVETPSGWTRQRPFQATVQRVQKITGLGSPKDVHHLELSLADSGIRYEPGDALGVWAPNAEATVAGVLEGLGINPAIRVEFDGTEKDVTGWLREHRELTRLTPGTVETYAEKTGSAELRSHWAGLDENSRREFLEARQFVDLVQEYPGRIAAADLVGLLRPLAPRSYSIASSQRVVDDEVHLTVATLFSDAIGVRRSGVASRHLNQRLQPGDTVGVFLEPNRRFRLPTDRSAPLILVGAGTGIAPYRAFLQQLEAEGHAPDTWLIYGNPHLRSDFLYQREWLRWRAEGLVHRIDGAFSRDGQDKRYVQHVVRENAGTIADWLDRGARLYLCGGLAMGRGVEQALLEGVSAARGLAAGAATEWLAGVRGDKRLLKDLY